MKHRIARELLNIEAVALRPDDPFTWSSGMKSPIYCDNRLTLSYPSLRSEIRNGLVGLIKEHFPDVDVIAGTATAGIPHAALVAEQMNLPMIYVRGSSKSHGKGNQIEGKIKRRDRVVIIEDLISTGGSVIHVQKALLEVGADVLGAAAIFTYGLEKGKQLLKEADLTYYTLTDYEVLLEAARESGYITKEEEARLSLWKKNPESTDWMSN